MSKAKTPKTLTEAIESLEALSHEKADDLKRTFEDEYHELKKTVDELKPYLEELKQKVESQVVKTKNEIEDKVKENPWATLAFIGFIAFILGCLFGRRTKEESQ